MKHIDATVNTDFAVKLPPARPNIEASFCTVLFETRDMWHEGAENGIPKEAK